MLVDEPFLGLDRTGRDALLDLFDRVHADGAALVVATHELTTVGAAQRLVALHNEPRWCTTAPHRAPTSTPSWPADGGLTRDPGRYSLDHVRVRRRQRLDLRGGLASPRSSLRSLGRRLGGSVAIVPAGSDITAYLKKTASDAAATTTDAPAAAGCGGHTPPDAASPEATSSEPAGWGTAPAATRVRGSGHDVGLQQRRRGVVHHVGLVDPGRHRHIGRMGFQAPPGRGRRGRGADGSRPARHPVGPGRLVRRSLVAVRAALLGRLAVDRARLARRPAVHRSARRLTAFRPAPLATAANQRG